ncbi:hypothetical protein [Pontibacter pamirensis]|uniref:hypothetical protein n=1 Tax=Pontibacter pamirensis TaxID=2562824 RepID=UPI00138A6449|nr:hypothetical protein [Pontibacter pamirensis]
MSGLCCCEVHGAAEMYLRRVREAIMLQGRNIFKREVLLEVAKEQNQESPELIEYARFEQELKNT